MPRWRPLRCCAPCWVLAVTAPTVRLAGLQKAVLVVGEACNPAFLSATAVLATEAFAIRGRGAARHGAQLLLPPAAVCYTMLKSSCCRGGAFLILAPAVSTMPSATTTGMSKRLAALNVAHFRAATAMPGTQSS